MTGGVSRRELLAGIGMAGAAIGSSAVGHSTASALLSDASQFAGNVLTAGEVDTSIAYEAHYSGSDGSSSSSSGTVDGDATGALDLPDLGSGDEGRFVLCPEIVGNPAYLWLCGGVTMSKENGKPDPEGGTQEPMQGSSPTDGQGGELEDAMEAELAYTDRSNGDRVVLLRGTFGQILGALQYGLPLSADPNYGATALDDFDGAGDQACFQGSDGPCIELAWWVPESVNNNIISDQLEFEFVFHAQQCRHNDGKRNPCAVEKGISFVSFCAEGSAPSGTEITAITERNEDGEPIGIEWQAGDAVDTIVLYYGTVFENFYVDGTSGTVTVGEGDIRLPKDLAAEYGQTPSDPCPEGETGIKYEYREDTDEFVQAE